MLKEKRVVNNNRTSMGGWHPDPIMNSLEKDGVRLVDETMKNARKWFNRPSYYQSVEGRLAGGMKRNCGMED